MQDSFFRATQQVQVLWETVLCFLKHLSIVLPHKPAIPLLGIFSKELKQSLEEMLYIRVHSSIIHNSPKVEASVL